jgi:hypothetical protein
MTKAVWLLLVSLLAWSLGRNVSAQRNDTESTKLESAKLRWEALQSQFGLLDYKYGVVDASSQTELSTSYIVLVEQDEVTSVEPFFWSNIEPDPANFLTVDDLFDLVDTNIESGLSVQATYDDVYGYPSQITIVSRNTDFLVDYVIEPMTIYTVAQDELDSNMALWNRTSSEDYSYNLRLSCFCVPAATLPKHIEVRGGDIYSIIDLESGLESENFFYNTLEFQFDEIQDAINDRWYVISTSYNDTMGYPTRVIFDVHPGLSDDERTTVISDVMVLGDPPSVHERSGSPTRAPSSFGIGNAIEYEIEDPPTPTNLSPAPRGPTSDSQSRHVGNPMTMSILAMFVIVLPYLSSII